MGPFRCFKERLSGWAAALSTLSAAQCPARSTCSVAQLPFGSCSSGACSNSRIYFSFICRAVCLGLKAPGGRAFGLPDLGFSSNSGIVHPPSELTSN